MTAWRLSIWIGGRRDPSTSLFYWDGLITYAVPLSGEAEADWRDGYPTYDTMECMRIRYDQGWRELECTTKRGFLCEKSANQFYQNWCDYITILTTAFTQTTEFSTALVYF